MFLISTLRDHAHYHYNFKQDDLLEYANKVKYYILFLLAK